MLALLPILSEVLLWKSMGLELPYFQLTFRGQRLIPIPKG